MKTRTKVSIGLFIVSAACFAVGQYPRAFGLANLPDCDAPEVKQLAQQILDSRIKGFSLSSFGEVTAASTSKRRVCRVEAKSAEASESEWLTLSVEPHGADEIFVQFMQPGR